MFCSTKALDRVDANENYNNDLWMSARDRVSQEDMIDDMENEATDIVLACDRVERGLMSIEDLGKFVMARRDHVLELLIKQQI
jgi:hypothetical protein